MSDDTPKNPPEETNFQTDPGFSSRSKPPGAASHVTQPLATKPASPASPTATPAASASVTPAAAAGGAPFLAQAAAAVGKKAAAAKVGAAVASSAAAVVAGGVAVVTSADEPVEPTAGATPTDSVTEVADDGPSHAAASASASEAAAEATTKSVEGDADASAEATDEGIDVSARASARMEPDDPGKLDDEPVEPTDEPVEPTDDVVAPAAAELSPTIGLPPELAPVAPGGLTATAVAQTSGEDTSIEIGASVDASGRTASASADALGDRSLVGTGARGAEGDIGVVTAGGGSASSAITADSQGIEHQAEADGPGAAVQGSLTSAEAHTTRGFAQSDDGPAALEGRAGPEGAESHGTAEGLNARGEVVADATATDALDVQPEQPVDDVLVEPEQPVDDVLVAPDVPAEDVRVSPDVAPADDVVPSAVVAPVPEEVQPSTQLDATDADDAHVRVFVTTDENGAITAQVEGGGDVEAEVVMRDASGREATLQLDSEGDDGSATGEAQLDENGAVVSATVEGAGSNVTAVTTNGLGDTAVASAAGEQASVDVDTNPDGGLVSALGTGVGAAAAGGLTTLEGHQAIGGVTSAEGTVQVEIGGGEEGAHVDVTGDGRDLQGFGNTTGGSLPEDTVEADVSPVPEVDPLTDPEIDPSVIDPPDTTGGGFVEPPTETAFVSPEIPEPGESEPGMNLIEDTPKQETDFSGWND